MTEYSGLFSPPDTYFKSQWKNGRCACIMEFQVERDERHS